MQCPVCHVGLEPSDLGEYGFVVLDVCAKCRGAWFDKRELDRLDESVWVNVEEQAFREGEGDRARISCPKCDVPLTSVSPPDEPELVVDRCTSCEGFWLDRGELEEVRKTAGDLHEQLAKTIRPRQKPLGMSSLAWAVHCFREFPIG